MGINKRHPLYVEDLDYILSTKGLERIRGKSFLITGATGLIGLCLIDALMRYNEASNAQIKIIAVGRSKEKASERLGEYFSSRLFLFLEQDVCLPFPGDLQVDYIIPLASNTHPMAYSQFPIETIAINTKGAEHALEKALACGATVLYPSSVEIYGNARGEEVFNEDYTGILNLSTARSCYTESKRVSESMCLSYMAEKSVDVKIVRLSRIFGATMLMSDTKASSQFIKNALASEDIVLKSKGEQYFSYTYVADAVSAILYVLCNGASGATYNISADGCNVHLWEFAKMCAEYRGKCVIFDLPTEKESKGFSIASQAILDNSRLLSLGWHPRYKMADGVRRTLEILKTEIIAGK